MPQHIFGDPLHLNQAGYSPRLHNHIHLSTKRQKHKSRVTEALCEETLFRDLLRLISREPHVNILTRHNVLYGNQMSKCRKDYLCKSGFDSCTRSEEDLVSLFVVILFPNDYDFISLLQKTAIRFSL